MGEVEAVGGVAEPLVCKTCGNSYKVTPKEIARWSEKKVPLPAHCPLCRKLNIIEERLKFIIKLLTRGMTPVKVTTEVTRVRITKKDPKDGEQELPKEPKKGVESQTPA